MQRSRLEITRSLAGQACGVLSAAARPVLSALPVRYESDGLGVRCSVPRWSDVAFLLTEDPQALLVIADLAHFDGRWLAYRGTGRLVDGHPDARFVTVVLQPSRVDLVDESLAWGVLDTFEPVTLRRSSEPDPD